MGSSPPNLSNTAGSGEFPWQRSDGHVFWGELAPSDHLLQIYESDEIFIDLLYGFVATGLKTGEAVIIIATLIHREALECRLRKAGFNLFDLKLKEQLMLLDAEEVLQKFMINDWPDENLFRHIVSGLVSRTRRYKGVRAFGEMVAILWAKGMPGATVQLEHLWNNFRETESFPLFCAYPRSGFTLDAKDSIATICCAHARMVTRSDDSTNDVWFKQIDEGNAIVA